MRKWLTYASSSNWLRVVGVATIVLLGAYTLVQQSTRLSANDLPLQTAQIAKGELQAGWSTNDVLKSVSPISTDLKTDNTVFAIVTDSNQKMLVSSAVLDGQVTLPPAGTFDVAKNKGVDKFTWQPETSVRLATVILPYQAKNTSGFVVTGQSLKPYEDRINTYGWITLAAWVGVVIWTTFIPIPYRQK